MNRTDSCLELIEKNDFARIANIMTENIPTVNTFAIFTGEEYTGIEGVLKSGFFAHQKILNGKEYSYIVPNIIRDEAIYLAAFFTQKTILFGAKTDNGIDIEEMYFAQVGEKEAKNFLIPPTADTYAIFTADPPKGEKYPSGFNKEKNKKLEKNLRDNNCDYQKILWDNAGLKRSYLVSNITREDAIWMGYEFEQKTILFGAKTDNGMYTEEICTIDFVSEDNTKQYKKGEVKKESNLFFNVQIPNNVFIEAYWGKDSEDIYQMVKENKGFSSDLNSEVAEILDTKCAGKIRWRKRGAMKHYIKTIRSKFSTFAAITQ